MEAKKNVGLIFGGKSGEHEISLASAINIYRALDPSKYEVTLIGIDKSGRWLMPSKEQILNFVENPRLIHLKNLEGAVSLVPYKAKRQFVDTDHNHSFLESKHFDVLIPILHGPFGEDGTVQGLLELSNIPYVGSGVLGSALGMDKDVSRRLLKSEGIPVVPTLVIRKHEYESRRNEIIQHAVETLGLPLFVKPANMGSSVGVHKIKDRSNAENCIEDAFRYDHKILFEKAIDARELECSVLGNFSPRASSVGEILPKHEFYSYEAKYLDEDGAALEIPAQNLSQDLTQKVRQLAIQAFQALECSGLARVDFFLERKTNELYLNEINTLPGFTKISMYPKLWEHEGLSCSRLIDELIELAIEKHSEKNQLKTSY